MLFNLEFEKIDIRRQLDYNFLLGLCSQKASDYSFINIWGWAEEYDLKWAWDTDNNLVWISQSIPSPTFWAPVGDWSNIDWAGIISEMHAGQEIIFQRVPEDLAQIWSQAAPSKIEVIDDRGHWDYIYSRKELVELKGKRFHKKKNLLNQFKKKYDYRYLGLGSEMVDLALEMQDNWCLWKDCEAYQILAAENRVISRVLKNWSSLQGISGGALEVDDILAAYTIAEQIDPESLIIHFEKGDPSFKGSYQAINHFFLSRCKDDILWVNREQDLGDEGLRKAKLSYNPVSFIRKFKVILK